MLQPHCALGGEGAVNCGDFFKVKWPGEAYGFALFRHVVPRGNSYAARGDAIEKCRAYQAERIHQTSTFGAILIAPYSTVRFKKN